MAPEVCTPSLQSPSQSKVVTGMPELRDDHEGICQVCAEGKHTREPFPSSVTNKTDILQLIHSYLSSMLLVKSLGGCSYYINFTDDLPQDLDIFFEEEG